MVSRSRPKAPLRAYRIADSRNPLFDGTGAYLKGGRWNSPGKRIVYAAETYAGALLEALVHLNFDEVPDNYSWIEILIPGAAEVEELAPGKIPGWNAADQTVTREFGNRWYEESRTPILLVPSVVTAGVEHNVLINQNHSRFASLRASDVRPVVWDERLLQP
jgi:RES domain-containing protein